MLKKYSISLAVFVFSISCLFSSALQTTDSLTSPIKCNSPISSYYGYREIFKKVSFHNGVDYACNEQTEIYCVYNGTIIFCGFNNFGYGNCIIILHDNGYKSLYGHLAEKFIITTGQYIFSGQLIGYVGPKLLSNGKLNGLTTGPHLHFSIFDLNGNSINPLTFKFT